MEKILLIDKPKGITSHDVIKEIRKQYPREKVGHAGTLDPLATGLLLVLVGNATKQQSEFTSLSKEYEIEVTFGHETDTYDKQGKITKIYQKENLKKLTEEEVRKYLQRFVGEIEQTVPFFSAVKVDGKKLYELARKGDMDKTILPKRKITINKIELTKFSSLSLNSLPKAKLRVSCSKGTYMRSLAHDLGQALDTGGYISQIRRTRIGKYSVKDAEKM